MKKLVLAILMAVGLMADGVVVGGEFGYGNTDVTASALGASETVGTKTKSLALKAGYQLDNIRLMGVLGVDKYKDDMIVAGEGNAVSLGIEAGYIYENILAAVTVARGEKDFVDFDQDFTDVGVRIGGIFEVDGANVEAGVQYKERTYDTYNYSGVGIDLEDETIGLYVGISFNL